MKKQLILAFCVLLVVAWLALVRFGVGTPGDLLSKRPTAISPPPIPIANVPPGTTEKNRKDAENEALARAYAAERARDRMERIKQDDRDYNTPITFYGVVVDLNGFPVPQASVDYSSTSGSFSGTRQQSTRTDGRFTISGIWGKYLDIQVAHPDYYEQPDSRRGFTYAGVGNGPIHISDSSRPEIFRLRKKGETAELIHQEDHVLFKGDEPERSFSLIDHSRRRDRPEYIILRRVETAERDNQGRPIRRLEMVAPEGGIQQRMDAFAFTAPANGYQPSMYFMRPTYGGQLDYFVRFSSGNYGRFTIMGTAGDYLIDSYLNPDGSPNLEHDPEKEITVVPTGKMGVDLLYPAKKEEPKRP